MSATDGGITEGDGKTLWHDDIGRMQGAPVTYEFDGQQYLLVSGGSSLIAYTLPK